MRTLIIQCLDHERALVQLGAARILLRGGENTVATFLKNNFHSNHNYWEEEALENIFEQHDISFTKRIYRVGGGGGSLERFQLSLDLSPR